MSDFVEAPESWHEIPLRRLFRRREVRGRADLPLLSVYRDWGVVQRAGRDDNYNKPGEDLDAYKHVQRGDLVLNKMKTWQGSLGVSAYEGIVSPAYFVAAPIATVDSRFIHHLLRSQPMIAEYAARSKGIRPSQWDLPWEEFSRTTAALPSAQEQRAIADYLDAETARIDALIEKKRRMISLLDEKLNAYIERETHASAINEAKGLSLPDNWRSVLLRRCFKTIQYGIGEASRGEGKVPVLGMGNVERGEIVGNPGGFVDEVDPSLLLETGDLLFNRTNSLALVGKVALVRNGAATTFASYLVRLQTNQLADSTYLNYLLNTQAVLQQARSIALPSIGQANLNPSRYTSVHIPLPSMQAQKTIANKLDSKASTHRRLSTALARQIELLTEHRQALITAAVTGEVEVPGV